MRYRRLFDVLSPQAARWLVEQLEEPERGAKARRRRATEAGVRRRADVAAILRAEVWSSGPAAVQCTDEEYARLVDLATIADFLDPDPDFPASGPPRD